MKYFLALGIDVPEAASAIYKNEEVTPPPKKNHSPPQPNPNATLDPHRNLSLGERSKFPASQPPKCFILGIRVRSPVTAEERRILSCRLTARVLTLERCSGGLHTRSVCKLTVGVLTLNTSFVRRRSGCKLADCEVRCVYKLGSPVASPHLSSPHLAAHPTGQRTLVRWWFCLCGRAGGADTWLVFRRPGCNLRVGVLILEGFFVRRRSVGANTWLVRRCSGCKVTVGVLTHSGGLLCSQTFRVQTRLTRVRWWLCLHRRSVGADTWLVRRRFECRLGTWS